MELGGQPPPPFWKKFRFRISFFLEGFPNIHFCKLALSSVTESQITLSERADLYGSHAARKQGYYIFNLAFISVLSHNIKKSNLLVSFAGGGGCGVECL